MPREQAMRQKTLESIKKVPTQVKSALASSFGRKCIAEFMGTFFLVFTVGCIHYNNFRTTAANWNFTSIACVLMVFVYALGNVSGAHFNPAVSVAVALAGKMEMMDCAMYCFVQTVAGFFGGICYHYMFAHHRHPQLLLGPREPYTWFETMNVEVIFTSMLCFVFLNVTTASKIEGNTFYGLAISFVIIAGGYAAGGISGAIFNPAVALGVELSSGSCSWCVLYSIYEFIGAGIASGLFSYVRPDDHGALPDLTGVFSYSLSEMCISEMIGTYYLCTTIGLCAMNNSPAIPWATGAALTSLTFSLDSVSGAHFNPALTFAFMLHKPETFTPWRAGSYILMQTVASISAAIVCKVTHLDGSFGFGPGVHAVFGWGPVMNTEIIYTFMLVYVVLCVCNGEKRLKEFHAVAIGSCVTAAGFAVGAVSGAALNPAVSLGPTIVHLAHGGNLFNGFAFVVFELFGSLLAVYAYKSTHTSSQKAPS
jgi:aquaporin Z